MTNRVLFVDDDRSILNTLERNLGFDFDLRVVDSGAAALKVVQREGDFSVVVVDMKMPGMSGLQTITALREVDPKIVFIMLSGNQDSTTEVDAVEHGEVLRFLMKPCEIQEVKNALNAAQQTYERQLQRV